MAVIKNQKTGMWEVRTYYKDWTGTRRQKTKRGFAKKSEAQEWECAFKLKDEMNINMKFKDFAELYLSDIQPRIKYNSFLTKKHIIETKILPYFGHRKLNEIRPADVIQWQNEIMKLKKDNGEAYSPTYLKTIHNQLSAILNHAVNMYDLKDNVARKAGSMGKEESKEIMFWTQEEYGRVRNDVREIISTLCKYKDVDIIAGAVCVDHIHLSVVIPPKISIANFMGYLKGKST